jgi:hypothetical protein
MTPGRSFFFINASSVAKSVALLFPDGRLDMETANAAVSAATMSMQDGICSKGCSDHGVAPPAR